MKSKGAIDYRNLMDELEKIEESVEGSCEKDCKCDKEEVKEGSGYDGYRVTLYGGGGALGTDFSQTEEGAQKYAVNMAQDMQAGDTIKMISDWSEHEDSRMDEAELNETGFSPEFIYKMIKNGSASEEDFLEWLDEYKNPGSEAQRKFNR